MKKTVPIVYILTICMFHTLFAQSKYNYDIEKTEGKLVISINEQPLLAYQYETVYPPKEVDSVYKRSGFIHPLRTLNGHVLTTIQPEDHYHHYGIWNPWTHVVFEGDTLDFWNLNKKEGTVRFAEFGNIINDKSSAQFNVLHEHVVLKAGKEKVALYEVQSIKLYQPDEDYYLADFTIEYRCATQSPFKILPYRYGGFGWRATQEWHKGNSEIITSEGKTRLDADGTTARWCMVQGELGDDYGGVIIMSFPKNYNYPEPLRIWPVNYEDRGDVFVNFSPTKNTEWTMLPGKVYTLKYRLAVFNGKMSAETAEKLWSQFTNR
ncbi:PmoA family protein [Abyssalbus ytuae]|uniref:PmoA family protein n=1 Tax=Abyssalbus ytuae TaxID=2926907 RepID=A0A9E7CTM7_9FLAO|nr:PmoA family protein [Abyssalbus ytuae]UOB16452.1 PmoA family protein [Abyssalbus ytuae]